MPASIESETQAISMQSPAFLCLMKIGGIRWPQHNGTCTESFDRLDLAVSHMNDTVRTLCYICIMRNENDRISVFR